MKEGIKRVDNFNISGLDYKYEWLTPPYILQELGEFDLDPCSPVDRLWDTAKKHYTILDNGLLQKWEGRVWLNPPYGKETVHWLRRLTEHGNGIALTFARTETDMFHRYIWDKADAILFFKGRLNFYTPLGEKSDASTAPSCLIAYGKNNINSLYSKRLNGKVVLL